METVGFILGVFCVYIFLIRIDSKRMRNHDKHIAPIAHRGLYSMDQQIPENSLEAFKQAIDSGYGIELDVQLSSDLEAFVFHDTTLHRMCGSNKTFEKLRSNEIKDYRLKQTDQTIPTLKEVLELVEGKTTLWIEIKTTRRRAETVDQVLLLLRDYPGEFSLCSFDPLILREIKKREPSILRGIIVEGFLNNKKFPFYQRIIAHFSLLNFLVKPDYQSYDYHQRSNPTYLLNKIMGAYSLFWAVGSKDLENKLKPDCDNVIFEHYRP